jgi:hypothetical protein
VKKLISPKADMIHHKIETAVPQNQRMVCMTSLAVFMSLISICLCMVKNVAAANDDLRGGINYAYSTWVGTGFYSVGDQSALILRGRLALPIIESQTERKWQLDLLLQGTIGFYNFLTDVIDVAAITAVPGLMLKYSVRENWWLMPFGQIGVGKDFSDGDTAIIGAAGIKSLANFSRANDAVWQLGNSLMFADNSDSDENVSDEGFSMFEIGLNRRSPIDYRVLGQPTDLNLFFIYTEFISDLEFFQVDFNDTRLKRLYKFGVALTTEEKFSILGIKFGGGGLHVSLGDNYFGIGFTTGFPF